MGDIVFDEEERHRCQTAFNLFDEDRVGNVPVSSLEILMRSLGLNPSQAEITKMKNTLDDTFDFEQYLVFHEEQLEKVFTEDDIRKAFMVFDSDNSGLISAQELKHILTTMGETLTEEQVDDMYKEVDIKQDSQIKYEDFMKILLSVVR
eukprot:TRINITY_DN5284_c0_g1_i1.p1 TRINITY_DN5284_c0_g1~~TRINITY_DN5284_c0_g1_i1.p1  ORF type:complete len:156 (-),score=44.72 TRINITY_DN5284_c0_g1_i1:57-503(-)